MQQIASPNVQSKNTWRSRLWKHTNEIVGLLAGIATILATLIDKVSVNIQIPIYGWAALLLALVVVLAIASLIAQQRLPSLNRLLFFALIIVVSNVATGMVVSYITRIREPETSPPVTMERSQPPSTELDYYEMRSELEILSDYERRQYLEGLKEMVIHDWVGWMKFRRGGYLNVVYC